MKWVIIGGGFKGIITAIILLKYNQQVTIIESGAALGGHLKGIKWNGYNLDLGCQIFDNSNSEITSLLLDILENNVKSIDVLYAGVTSGYWSKNYTVPDLSHEVSLKAQILDEIKSLKPLPLQESKTLKDYLHHRFGKTAGELLCKAADKKLGFAPSLLSSQARDVLFFDRVKILNEDISINLKEDPFYDERLAVYSHSDPMKYYSEATNTYKYRNFYPKVGGMSSFSEQAKDFLIKRGVDIIYSDEVDKVLDNSLVTKKGLTLSFERLVWSADVVSLENKLLARDVIHDYVYSLPMVLIYFEVPVEDLGPYTYVHDHSANTYIFRVSTAGLYSGQIIKGKTYICCEIPTSLDALIWNTPELYIENIWQEVCDLNVCDGKLPKTFKILKAPKTFNLPLIGYSSAYEKLKTDLNNKMPNLFFIDPLKTSLTDISDTILKDLKYDC